MTKGNTSRGYVPVSLSDSDDDYNWNKLTKEISA